MWLFNDPPKKLLSRKYAFQPDRTWLEHLQRSSVRFRGSASGSLVSSAGLVLTNHHVAAGAIQRLSSPAKDLSARGFYARTRSEELPCAGLELEVLVGIEDVTGRVN